MTIKAINRKGIRDCYLKVMKDEGVNFEIRLGGSVILFYTEDDAKCGIDVIKKLNSDITTKTTIKSKDCFLKDILYQEFVCLIL